MGIVILGLLFITAFCISACVINQPDPGEDEAQIQYLNEYNKRKAKKNEG